MSLKTQLIKTLQPLSKDSEFEIQDVQSNLFKSSEILIKQHEGETFCRHRLLLVSTKTEGFLSGLESYEYVLSQEKSQDKYIVYISKVDTTMNKYKGLTARLVQAYIASLPSSTSVFVFARAQPEYLFAESAKNTSKSVLNDRQLVSWWLSTLNKVSVPCEGWWSVPGIDDQNSALIEIGARKREWQASHLIKWNYGTSYSKDAKACQVIPRFDDDAKARLLKSLHSSGNNDDMTVEDFWNILSIGEECGSGKVTGFFELKLLDDREKDVISEKQVLKRDEFTLFWNKFMSLDFHDSESNLKSTQQALADMKRLFPDAKPIIVEKSTEIAAKTDDVNSSTAGSSEKRSAVNLLTGGFIKRKKI